MGKKNKKKNGTRTKHAQRKGDSRPGAFEDNVE